MRAAYIYETAVFHLAGVATDKREERTVGIPGREGRSRVDDRIPRMPMSGLSVILRSRRKGKKVDNTPRAKPPGAGRQARRMVLPWYSLK